MPWNQNFRYNLHCKHTFWHLKLKTKDFSKFLKQYTCTFQTTACMHLTLQHQLTSHATGLLPSCLTFDFYEEVDLAAIQSLL